MSSQFLVFTCAGNFLNVILDPILIFLCGLGISGAAIATVISEYVRNAGPIPMAGHQICMQVWLSISLLTDALALAGQALLASSYSLGNYEQARLIIYRVIQIGLGAGISLSMILFVGFGPFSTLFSTDSEVLDVARSDSDCYSLYYLNESIPCRLVFFGQCQKYVTAIRFVAGSQPVNALAFVIDGIYYGVSDFEYAAYSMVVVGLISSIFMLVATPVVGLPGVWTGLFLFMMLRVLAGVWRLSSKSGPWDMVWYKDGAED
ncbi:MATE efflux family protein chloroplastic-like [Trifolium pratense]|uniref:MATE efflux family protein chloroplastic-like n=1 Tax=Trifolium pratense TaxID=57577 RepID=A0A2K3PD52_TRIPR|nr:MATE efflux family protein chloroplastic-like [Trifolium pratense]